MRRRTIMGAFGFNIYDEIKAYPLKVVTSLVLAELIASEQEQDSEMESPSSEGQSIIIVKEGEYQVE